MSKVALFYLPRCILLDQIFMFVIQLKITLHSLESGHYLFCFEAKYFGRCHFVLRFMSHGTGSKPVWNNFAK